MTPRIGVDRTNPIGQGLMGCLLIDGTVAQGPEHLRGRSLDDLVNSPAVMPASYSGFPVTLSPDGYCYVANTPWGQTRFLSSQTAACAQHYLDGQNDTYAWQETPAAGDAPATIAILKKGAGEASFAFHPNRPTHGVLARAPDTPENRQVMEKGLRAMIKGQMHQHFSAVRPHLGDPRIKGDQLSALARSTQVMGTPTAVPPEVAGERPLPQAGPQTSITVLPSTAVVTRGTLPDQQP